LDVADSITLGKKIDPENLITARPYLHRRLEPLEQRSEYRTRDGSGSAGKCLCLHPALVGPHRKPSAGLHLDQIDVSSIRFKFVVIADSPSDLKYPIGCDQGTKSLG